MTTNDRDSGGSKRSLQRSASSALGRLKLYDGLDVFVGANLESPKASLEAFSAAELRRSQTMGACGFFSRRSDPGLVGLGYGGRSRAITKAMSQGACSRPIGRSLSSPRQALTKMASMASSIHSQSIQEDDPAEHEVHPLAADTFICTTHPIAEITDEAEGEHSAYASEEKSDDFLTVDGFGQSLAEEEVGGTDDSSSKEVPPTGCSHGSRLSAPACISRSVGRSRLSQVSWSGTPNDQHEASVTSLSSESRSNAIDIAAAAAIAAIELEREQGECASHEALDVDRRKIGSTRRFNPWAPLPGPPTDYLLMIESHRNGSVSSLLVTDSLKVRVE